MLLSRRKTKTKQKCNKPTLLPKGEEKKNKGNLKKPMCTCTSAFLSIKKKLCTWAFLSIKKKFISTQFSLHFGEPVEKKSGPHHLFSILPTQPNTFQKSFSFLFSLYSFPSTLFHLQTNTSLGYNQFCS